MATEKTISARMQMKTDTALNWSKAINFIPKKGEIIIYEADSDYGYERMKIGDGSTKVNDLPFVIGAKDWLQNDSTASDYIKNRPGGYTVNYPALNIEWDGVIGDRVSVDALGSKFVKVSDEIRKAEEFVGGTVSINEGDVYETISITDALVYNYGYGIYGCEVFFVVNKAPANLVNQSTGEVLAVFPETGIYFIYDSQDGMTSYASSLSLPAKSEIVPIPGELTNIVGGYVRAERKDPLIDAVVSASSFEPYTTPSETYYEAPIALGFTPADGDLIKGTISGVEVNGSWIGRSKYANLYRGGNAGTYEAGNTNVPFCTIGFRNEKAVISLRQDSAPTTDYELHLYRYVPSGIVQIPQEYVEGLEETTANASEALETATAAQSTATAAQSTATAAQSTATAAQSTADAAKSKAEIASNVAYTAQSTANTAQSTADTAKITANTAKNTADAAKITAESAKSTAESAQSTASGAYPSAGQSTFNLKGNPTGLSGNMRFVGIADNPIYCYVDRSSHSDANAPARFAFKTNGSSTMQVEGIDVLQMRSSGGKKFNLTVDDTGTISATEVTT